MSSSRKRWYVCQECGFKSPGWVGRCPECGTWGSVVEEVEVSSKTGWVAPSSKPVPVGEVKSVSVDRVSTGMKELDRVFGGGVVKGSVLLISGEPGIGKSTLLLQLCGALSGRAKLLYVTAEESPEQVGMRAERLGITENNLFIVADGDLKRVEEHIKELSPGFVVFDSIQTMYMAHIDSAPGSVSQVRESTAFITGMCKSSGMTAFIVGHVTKEGSIAGPKILEHMVDAVFHLEGDRGYNLRLFRSLKNRFGSTGEFAVFEMTERGLVEVPNPSEFFLSERPIGKPGSVVFAGVEGNRPILLEVQALVTRAVFATPQRRARGIDTNRLSIIIAVLEKELGYPLRNYDVFVNVVGGVKVTEPGVDLPVAVAIASSYLNIPVKEEFALFGEVGLAGEVRSVRLEDLRRREAERNGFKIPHKLKSVADMKTLLV